MMLSVPVGAAVFLMVGEIFIMAAAGTFKRELEWPEFVALIMPPAALVSILFLHWAMALVLTIALFAVVIWTVEALLKAPGAEAIQVSAV